MMKRYLSIAFALALSSAALAQPCTTTRYASDVFPTITTTTGILYGANTGYNGVATNLTLDLYQPTGDTAMKRPLIIWVHGGSFVGGTSADYDVTSLSQHFAKKGYVCASINYRVGTASFDSVGLIPAVVRAVQDLKASIRFFYKDRATVNAYKIDTNNIFIGGSSAGAITVLHAQYMKLTCEVNAWITPSNLAALGGLDGYSGNQCYSSKVNGVIDLCGALARYGYLKAGDLPLCSMHGTSDATVPYGRGMVNPGVPIMMVDGSRMIYQQSLAVGVSDKFYTWLGAPHVPYNGSSASQLAYMDTTVRFVRDYLISRLGITCSPLQVADATSGTATLYAFTDCSTTVTYNCSNVGILEHKINLFEDVYPNPSTGIVNVVFVNNNATYTVELMDITGRIVKSDVTTGSGYTFEKGALGSGVYFLKVSNTKGEAAVRKIIFY
ncbi:MAG: T9SS type A sorting domain-containing protein [Bacteroidia bacterium]